MLRWFAALPAAIIRRRLRLNLYYAPFLLLSGQFETVNERLRDAEQSLVQHGEEIPSEERRIVKEGRSICATYLAPVPKRTP